MADTKITIKAVMEVMEAEWFLFHHTVRLQERETLLPTEKMGKAQITPVRGSDKSQIKTVLVEQEQVEQSLSHLHQPLQE